MKMPNTHPGEGLRMFSGDLSHRWLLAAMAGNDTGSPSVERTGGGGFPWRHGLLVNYL